jgi:hypothetical protein
MNKKVKIRAKHNILLHKFKIPKGTEGYVSSWSKDLERYKAFSDNLCVKFPNHRRFVCLLEEVEIINE